jgi:parallel beta-helix repeat protein
MRNNSINKNRNQGIQIYDSGNNTLEQNHITSNNNSGIYLYLTGNNSIYDNIFNNTNNFEIYYSDGNIWNMTVIQNMNIIGGHYMGGNFWANPSGSGFSQTCIDADMNGICDSSYELIPGNTDIHPLMVASGYLNGTVTSNGSAVSGACIITTGANTTSDPDGVYSLIVPAGTYNITVTKQPTHNDSKVAGIIVNSSDITTLDIVLSQKPTGTITGIVYEA